MTDWNQLSARGGIAAHDLVGWLMWDPAAIAAFGALGVANPGSWIVAWRAATTWRMSIRSPIWRPGRGSPGMSGRA